MAYIIRNFKGEDISTKDTLDEALDFAASLVGNRSYIKPFTHEETFVFGPGDGTATIIVRPTKE